MKCSRCGWTWVPRVKKPKVCPGCHSVKWNVPKSIKEKGIKSVDREAI